MVSYGVYGIIKWYVVEMTINHKHSDTWCYLILDSMTFYDSADI